MLHKIARLTLNRLRAAGFAVSCISFVAAGGGVEIEAWRGPSVSTRPADARVWVGRGRSMSEAIRELDEAIREEEDG